MLAAVAPLLTCFAAALLIFLRAGRAVTLRESLLISATLAAGWLVLGVELLSWSHAIRFWPVFLWWIIPLLVLLGLLGREIRRPGRRAFPRWPRLTIFQTVLLAIVVFLAGWSWVQAWFSPPNNIDSQEYHLQRQVFWMQQESVEHYPTTNLRQVAMPPLAEFAGLTLMVLTDGDRYHNLVQWFAFLLSAVAVSLTARRFDRSATPQLLAALWVVTIPLSFLQASTTKNDVVVLMFSCVIAYWVLLLATRTRLRWPHLALLGLAFGALTLTKGTGLIFGLPLGALAAFFLVRYHARTAAPALAAIAVVALALNAGHFERNFRAFGSVAPDRPGVHDGPALGNADHSPGALVSITLRNLGAHGVLPYQPYNDRLGALMHAVHAKLGRELDDPQTTWMPGGRFRPYKFYQNDEDRAAAPAHLLLTLLLPAGMFWARRQIPWRASAALLLVSAAGLFLFSFLLKWQYWHARLIITLPALLAPVFGWCFAAPRLRYAAPAAAALLTATIFASLNCMQRPLWGPKNIFAADPLALRCYLFPNRAGEYRALVERIAPLRPAVVGFFTGAGAPDYPMQRLLLDGAWPRPRFMAFNAKLQIPGKPEPAPDVLLVARSNARRLQHAATGLWYRQEEKFGRYTLFLKEAE